MATVSTHSRPKAAGQDYCRTILSPLRFNTQPPEGGWQLGCHRRSASKRFNTQPPEGGWEIIWLAFGNPTRFNTQPPEGGWVCCRYGGYTNNQVSTHSRPKAAGQECLSS